MREANEGTTSWIILNSICRKPPAILSGLMDAETASTKSHASGKIKNRSLRMGCDVFFDADSKSLVKMQPSGVIGEKLLFRGHVIGARQVGARTLIARNWGEHF